MYDMHYMAAERKDSIYERWNKRNRDDTWYSELNKKGFFGKNEA